jgi:hypothetical protein
MDVYQWLPLGFAVFFGRLVHAYSRPLWQPTLDIWLPRERKKR